MPVPASRLDRLLALMEGAYKGDWSEHSAYLPTLNLIGVAGGNSKSIRKSAALQVASYVYSKPSQLYHIIVKVPFVQIAVVSFATSTGSL